MLEQNNLLEQKVNLLEQKNKILRKSILLREYTVNPCHKAPGHASNNLEGVLP